MNLRDVPQIGSFILSFVAIGICVYKVRRAQSYPFFFLIFYLPPLVIFTLTAIYYLFVYYDTYVSDIIVSGDMSAVLRTIDLAMWIIVVSARPIKRKV
jgi:hypothetical protein